MSGLPVFGDDGRQVRYTAQEGAISAFWFMPLAPSKQTETRWVTRLAKKYWTDRKADILARYRTATPKERRNMMKLVRDFNVDQTKVSGGVLTPAITSQTLNRALRSRPNKRELAYRNG